MVYVFFLMGGGRFSFCSLMFFGKLCFFGEMFMVFQHL